MYRKKAEIIELPPEEERGGNFYYLKMVRMLKRLCERETNIIAPVEKELNEPGYREPAKVEEYNKWAVKYVAKPRKVIE